MPCFVLLDGCVSRLKQGGGDGRSIVSFELPGDVINVESLLLGSIDCGAQAVCRSAVAVIDRNAVARAWQSSRTLEVALWRSACVKAASFEEWLLNIGRRSPIGRLSHLFCELRTRLIAVGLPEVEAAKLPFSPHDLADAMGLQHVIVTRCLHELASRRLIALSEGLVVIHDVAGLAKVGDVKSDDLHMNG